jgi:5-methylcytosine-specific restriction protein B
MKVSSDAKQVLKLLATNHNVLVQGAPGTGKTHLSSAVREAFLIVPPLPYDPLGQVPFPKSDPNLPEDLADWLPSPGRRNRSVFTTVFHQGTKHRDFISGIVPIADGGTLRFRVHRGVLMRAIDHALSEDGVSLLLIEEINRGPAVAAFGGSLVALESDKRLSPDDTTLPSSVSFEALDENGDLKQVYLPANLYFLATMNQSDTSVEALDVAFLRRWAHFRIEPSAEVLESYFKLNYIQSSDPALTLTISLYDLAVKAWKVMNSRVSIGRGPEFQMGHGLLMHNFRQPPTDPVAAIAFLLPLWERMRAHIDEVFFGDVSGISGVLNIGPHNPKHPYQLVECEFAGGSRLQLVLQPTTEVNLPEILRYVVGGKD